MGWFLHIDMDAFYASVEQALNPRLQGKPVIVGGRDGRGVVTSASYEARKFGVRSAMPAFQARRLCPQGIFLPNRHRAYSEYSRRVFAILKRYSPEVRALSIDEGRLNLAGTERLFGPPLGTADTIIRRIQSELRLPASGGLSASGVTAKIAATRAKPRGLMYVPAGAEREFLAPLGIEAVPGIGPKAQRAFRQKGIRTIGDLMAHGGLADRYLDFEAAPDHPRRHDHSMGHETTFDQPVAGIAQMEKILWELVEELGARLRAEGLHARCLTVKIRSADFRTITRSRTLPFPTCFDHEMFATVSSLVRKNVAPARPVRLLGISASALQRGGWQEPLFNRDRRCSLERLYRGIDELRRKYGEHAIGVATPRHRPVDFPSQGS